MENIRKAKYDRTNKACDSLLHVGASLSRIVDACQIVLEKEIDKHLKKQKMELPTLSNSLQDILHVNK